jgi:hypothetical protein
VCACACVRRLRTWAREAGRGASQSPGVSSMSRAVCDSCACATQRERMHSQTRTSPHARAPQPLARAPHYRRARHTQYYTAITRYYTAITRYNTAITRYYTAIGPPRSTDGETEKPAPGQRRTGSGAGTHRHGARRRHARAYRAGPHGPRTGGHSNAPSTQARQAQTHTRSPLGVVSPQRPACTRRL